jgi:type IV secretion system protein VirB9
MRRTIGWLVVGAVLLGAPPTLADAQTESIQVPAIAQAAATAEATVGGPLASDQMTHPSGGTENAAAVSTAGQQPPASGPVLPSMPPPINLVSPSAPLDEKEQQAVAIAGRWANRRAMPHPGKDGVIRFLYGATLPTVVCAPLHVCDLALQPGEIVNNVNVGDKVRWNVSPAMSGSTAGEITHMIIKPTDAGLVSSMTIETNQRTYAVKLVSTEAQWMPLIGFNYPDDMERQWSAYQQRAAWATASSTLPSGQNIANLDFGFRLSGDDPAWRPLRVYTDGAKTYIQFPRAMAFGAAPALVGLDNGRHWFSRRPRQMVNYRVMGDRYIVDNVLDRAELVSGVGDDQTRVLITRDGAR